MDIIIQSLGFKAGDQLESFVREKLNTLKQDKIVRANVILFKGPESAAEPDYCEIRLEVPGNDPFVKRNSTHFETAVIECVELLQEIMNRAKEKQIDRRQAEAVEIQDAINEAEALTDPELEDVVKVVAAHK